MKIAGVCHQSRIICRVEMVWLERSWYHGLYVAVEWGITNHEAIKVIRVA